MVAILKILARKISKLIYFIMLLMFLGKTFPEAELYIGEDFATKWALIVYGDESADSMYEAFTDIDNFYDLYFYIHITAILPVTLFIYVMTMKLIKKIWKK